MIRFLMRRFRIKLGLMFLWLGLRRMTKWTLPKLSGDEVTEVLTYSLRWNKKHQRLVAAVTESGVAESDYLRMSWPIGLSGPDLMTPMLEDHRSRQECRLSASEVPDEDRTDLPPSDPEVVAEIRKRFHKLCDDDDKARYERLKRNISELIETTERDWFS